MLDPGLVSIAVLLLLFVASMSSRVNLGLICFPAAFLVGWYAGVPADDVTGFFPANFFVLVVGVMALFSVAQSNGTLAYLLSSALRLVGGRVRLIPWLMFLVGALLTGLGTLPAAAVAMVAPIALGLAARYRFPSLLMILAGFTGCSPVASPPSRCTGSPRCSCSTRKASRCRRARVRT